MMRQDDHDLLIQIAARNEDALRTLHARYLPILRRYLWYRHDLSLEQIEDVLQETFLSVWRSAKDFREASQVSAWLFQIAHRYALRVYRAEDRRLDGHALPLGDENEPLQDSLEQTVLTRMSLVTALESLSTKHREVLYFVIMQGFSVDEVAHVLEIPSGTVKSRLSYARHALQQQLRRDHDQSIGEAHHA